MSGVIQMSQLGRYGRFGNCLFQSAFLHCYAKQHDLTVQAPKFPGQEIFSFRFDPIEQHKPTMVEKTSVTDSCTVEPPSGDEYVNRDVSGYFQFHTGWYRPFKRDLQVMFKPVISPTFSAGDRTVVGMHSRWGDYDNRKHAWRAPTQWYVNWVNENWGRLTDPVLLICAEDQKKFMDGYTALCKPGTSAFDAIKASITVPESSYKQDWVNLQACDIVLMPNSTFGFTAALFSSKVRETWRASLPDEKFVNFDVWFARPLLPDACEKYPHLVDLPVDTPNTLLPDATGAFKPLTDLPRPQYMVNVLPPRTSCNISVVIPCFNQGQWLRQAINSVRKQTWPAAEIIVVDDGSTDSTAEVAQSMGVRVVTAESNSGPAAARNLGIKVATGNFILPLDADDVLHAKFIERTLLYRNRSDIIGTHVQNFGFENSVWRQRTLKPTLQDMLYENSLVVTSLYRREMWEAIGGYNTDYNYVEDWEFWLRALAAGYRAIIIPEVLFYYRHWDGPSVSKSVGLRVVLRNEVRARYGYAGANV